MGSASARRPLVAGNWKMNLGPAKAELLVVEALAAIDAQDFARVDIVLCPPAISLERVAKTAAGRCSVGAQNMHWEASGAFTGEISAPMLQGICQYVILGHSERRAYFAETDDGVRRKVVTALANGLTPIVCCGESLLQREAGLTNDWVALQIRAALHGLSADELARLVVAYEPIWAIGTGLAASGEIAQQIIGHIRGVLIDLAGIRAEEVRILYGGSVTGANAQEYFGQADIDGALVGGASLKPADFSKIIHGAAI